jgi:hypothetical protein
MLVQLEEPVEIGVHRTIEDELREAGSQVVGINET